MGPCKHGHDSGRYADGKCRECRRLYKKAYRQRYKAEIRKQNRDYLRRHRAKMQAAARRRAGLPEPTRPEPERCELCDKPPNGRGSLHLDHDHGTGRFRGWLCSNCNTAIGKLGDTAESLQRAVDYLQWNLYVS